MEDYQRILLVKNDVQVFKIPPKTTSRAYRASEWNLDSPDWICRLRLVSVGKKCFIKLDEKNTGQFFGQCPVESFSSDSIEPVSDSSRYFALKLVDEDTGRMAFIGIGFVDRSDSFDLNVALQDHFKILKHEEEDNSDSKQSTPKLDLGFKDGQTIKVNLNIKKKPTSTKSKTTIGLGVGGVLLPPPPGSKALSTTPSSSSSSSFPNISFPSATVEPAPTSSNSETKDLVKDLENLNFGHSSDSFNNSTTKGDGVSKSNVDLLLDFGEFESNFSSSHKASSDSNWANFD